MLTDLIVTAGVTGTLILGFGLPLGVALSNRGRKLQDYEMPTTWTPRVKRRVARRRWR